MTDIHNLASSLVKVTQLFVKEYPEHNNPSNLFKQKETLEQSKRTIDVLTFVRKICSINSLKYKAYVEASRMENYNRGQSGLTFHVQIGFSPLEYNTLHDFLNDFYADTVGAKLGMKLMRDVVSESITIEYRNNDDIPMERTIVPVINVDPNMVMDEEGLEECYVVLRKQLFDHALGKEDNSTLFNNIDFTLMQGSTRIILDIDIIVALGNEISETLLEEVYPS